ncbi:MAG: hypothetical protein PHV37_01700 [Candidatus Gastranaerophilales bacterium]|nr:hypothetical protein [Candidatus Gastranaerophilales bacterium]
MGKFITGKTEFRQSNKDGRCYALHNQLYQDDDGLLYLVPRFFLTDGFTIPKWLAPIGGGRMEWDVRPAIGHDFDCKYHQTIVVNATVKELFKNGFIKIIEKLGEAIVICEDLPLNILSVKKISFSEANSKFKRMMKAVECIKNWRINMMRFAVNFNLGWLKSGKEPIDLNKIYKEPI